MQNGAFWVKICMFNNSVFNLFLGDHFDGKATKSGTENISSCRIGRSAAPGVYRIHSNDSEHRRRSSVNFRGHDIFPEKYVRKINKMPEFYTILVRKIGKIPEFVYFLEKLTKFPSFT